MNVSRQPSAVSRQPRGITLLELIVTMAIGTVMFMIVGAIFIGQGQFFAIEDALSETQVHAYRTLDATGLYMSSARSILASRTINGTLYTTGTNTVVLELPSIDSSGTIIGATYDYVAIGIDPVSPAQFMTDLDAGTGSARVEGKHAWAQLVDKVIFRYNTVIQTSATAVELYVRTTKTARGRVIKTPLGKIYYLGAS